MRRDSIQRSAHRRSRTLEGDSHRRPDDHGCAGHLLATAGSRSTMPMQAHTMSVAALVRYTRKRRRECLLRQQPPAGVHRPQPSRPIHGVGRPHRDVGPLGRLARWPRVGARRLNQHWNFTWAGVPYHALRISTSADPGPRRGPDLPPADFDHRLCFAHLTHTGAR